MELAHDQESATEGLPVAKSYAQDTEVPIRTAIERGARSEPLAKSKSAPASAPAAKPKAHELPLWVWLSLGASGLVILLLLAKILFG